MRAYMLYLVGIVIFVDKSVTYVDVIYMRYFDDFEWIHEYNGGTAYLVYLYSKLFEAYIWKTKQMIGLILQHFPHIFGWSCLPTYTQGMSCASAFFPLKRNPGTEPFRAIQSVY